MPLGNRVVPSPWQVTLSLVHPQPLGQILKRHEHNRIITPHQRRLAHPGPHRPTLTTLQLDNQIRQCMNVRERACRGRHGMEDLGERQPR
jgi:hypothetical protein